jgi:hypothetical protein
VTSATIDAIQAERKADARRMVETLLLRSQVPSDVAQQFFKEGKLDTIERLLDHDSDIGLPAEQIPSMIRSLSIDTPDDHRRFVKILEMHPDQYAMSGEVKITVNSQFRRHGSDKPLKDMYYNFAGWTDLKEQNREAIEGC